MTWNSGGGGDDFPPLEVGMEENRLYFRITAVLLLSHIQESPLRHNSFHNEIKPTCFWTSSSMRNPVNSEDITIFCDNVICFIRIAPVGNNLALKRGKEHIYLHHKMPRFLPTLQYNTLSHNLLFIYVLEQNRAGKSG